MTMYIEFNVNGEVATSDLLPFFKHLDLSEFELSRALRSAMKERGAINDGICGYSNCRLNSKGHGIPVGDLITWDQQVPDDAL